MLKVTDVGYGYSKGEDLNKNKIIVESVWGEVQQKVWEGNLSGENGTHQIATEHGTFFLGKTAMKQSVFQTRRQDRDWIKTPGYLALHLYLLSEMTTSTNAEVQLVTGLPISYYSDQSELRNRLQKTHIIKRHGRRSQQRITITDVICLPQGLAAVFSEALDDNGNVIRGPISEGRAGLLDIGSHTVNISDFEKLEPISKHSTSIEAGMWNVLSEVGKRINAAFPGQGLTGHEVVDVMKQGFITHRGRKQDVNGIVLDVVEPFIDRIIGEASAVWGEAARLDVLLVAGGGAEIVGPAIIERYDQAQIVPHAQWANTRGYLKFGRRILGAQ